MFRFLKYINLVVEHNSDGYMLYSVDANDEESFFTEFKEWDEIYTHLQDISIKVESDIKLFKHWWKRDRRTN